VPGLVVLPQFYPLGDCLVFLLSPGVECLVTILGLPCSKIDCVITAWVGEGELGDGYVLHEVFSQEEELVVEVFWLFESCLTGRDIDF